MLIISQTIRIVKTLRLGLTAAVCAWVLAVLAGVCSLASYSATPGAVTHADRLWPAGDQLKRTSGATTLVMTVLPQCPCSRASIHELEELMSRCHGKLCAYAIFDDQISIPSNTDTSLWKLAAQIDGVTCVHDPDGKLTDLFRARTSGQVFVYDDRGVLRFSGGITESRAHEGDNDGLAAVEAIANGVAPLTARTPVFGCSFR